MEEINKWRPRHRGYLHLYITHTKYWVCGCSHAQHSPKVAASILASCQCPDPSLPFSHWTLLGRELALRRPFGRCWACELAIAVDSHFRSQDMLCKGLELLPLSDHLSLLTLDKPTALPGVLSSQKMDFFFIHTHAHAHTHSRVCRLLL